MRNNDDDLVYSTDQSVNIRAQKNRKSNKAPVYKNRVDANDFAAILSVEKSGRKGKTVTVIRGLPNTENYLKPLAKELKAKAGSGGTFILGEDGQGVIEIQGDKRDILRELLQKKEIKVKG